LEQILIKTVQLKRQSNTNCFTHFFRTVNKLHFSK